MTETTKLSEEIWMDEKAIGVDNHSNYGSEIEVDEETIQVRARLERFSKFFPFLLSFAMYSSFINTNLILFYFRIAMYDAPEATSKKTLVQQQTWIDEKDVGLNEEQVARSLILSPEEEKQYKVKQRNFAIASTSANFVSLELLAVCVSYFSERLNVGSFNMSLEGAKAGLFARAQAIITMDLYVIIVLVIIIILLSKLGVLKEDKMDEITRYEQVMNRRMMDWVSIVLFFIIYVILTIIGFSIDEVIAKFEILGLKGALIYLC
ncbi:uncharacterized protein RJT20DRAFT_391 [Scheffersomyces xylosifermentans]|uniref:uncharacterized protein n=1 Tax=Scheffersomyces xylosifermentans TaxID=1304137 RepID=UPI00315CED75